MFEKNIFEKSKIPTTSETCKNAIKNGHFRLATFVAIFSAKPAIFQFKNLVTLVNSPLSVPARLHGQGAHFGYWWNPRSQRVHLGPA